MFSIIIPTYSRKHLLIQCLDLLAPGIQNFPAQDYRVIVTDDSSDESIKTLINEQYDWIEYVKGPCKGPASNRNNGAHFAKENWLVFVDDDCLPDRNLLLSYSVAIQNNQEAKVLEGSTHPDRPMASLDEISPINETGGNLWSCNFCIERQLFEKLQGFDENFPGAAMEDVDLKIRIEKMKMPIVFVSEAIVIHPWRKKKNFGFYLGQFDSTVYFLKKHPEQIPFHSKKMYFSFIFRHFAKSFLFLFRNSFRGFRYLWLELFINCWLLFKRLFINLK